MATKIKPVPKTEFDRWWTSGTRRGFGTPHDSARAGWSAAEKLYKKAVADLLDMLEEWDPTGGNGMSGFAGHAEVTAAEQLLGREESTGV